MTHDEARIPRGIRNNNPMNVRERPNDKTRWSGERATDDDPAFEEFETMEDGVRCGAKILLNYQRLYHLKTVRQILNRFAPPAENDTDSYVRHIADKMRVDSDEPVNLKIPGRMLDLVAAIIDHENGYRPDGSPWVSTATIMDGVLKVVS
jgi:hypothetical protein